MKAGITGHQDLGNKSSIVWTARALRRLIFEFHVDFGYSSLAAGSDQLFASLLHQEEIPFEAIIPSQGYEKTFKLVKHKEQYEKLLASAVSRVTLDFSFPEEKAFLAAGRRVVDSSEIVFAVWNGKMAKGLGGTADIVKYAIAGGKKVIYLNPINKTRRDL